MIPASPGGPSVITRTLTRGRQERRSGRRCDDGAEVTERELKMFHFWL